uniref:Hydroxymethylglutaryl-CoA synthase n=1 Tax=Onchocerca volvulus TaxID=6282 RepID=A0A8R1TV97_ONCVO
MKTIREVWLADQVGIRGIELYIPKLYINQKDLEVYDNVEKGKYTIGLGQDEMSFCADHEDITSICLTVVSKLLRNYRLSAKDIGFLCVGTETLIDKSKSIKTSLMKLFEENSDIEGVDVKNACYGGTQALFHAVDWVYANWELENRYAVVVMADIAVYDVGPARCTGGVGAFAALVGPNAVLTFERGLRATYMIDVYDFYKPNQPVLSEYPVVEGQGSLQAYLTAVDETYKLYCQKAEKLKNEGLKFLQVQTKNEDLINAWYLIPVVKISNFDAVFFHCPFTRLVQKGFGILAFIDFKRGLSDHLSDIERAKPTAFLLEPREINYMSRDFTKMSTQISSKLWAQKTEPFLLLNRRIGNTYTASLYLQLISFFHRQVSKYFFQKQFTSNSFSSNVTFLFFSSSVEEDLNGRRLLFFSYGSGAASAMFSARIFLLEKDTKDQFAQMKQSADAAVALLEQRLCINPKRYSEIMALREKLLSSAVPYRPEGVRNNLTNEFSLFPNTYYLMNIGDKYRRYYAQTSS